MKKAIAGILLLGVALVAQSRITRSWSYQELYDQADLVIIAKPTSVQETAEKAVLPNLAPDVHVIGLSTEFAISLVMKGNKTFKKATLHHYRLANPEQPMLNGPMLASFDTKQPTRFLLFLKREQDERYAPVSGQTDPSMISIIRLEGGAQ